MAKNNFKQEFNFFGLTRAKIIMVMVILLIGALFGWYCTSEFLQPEQIKQLNQRLSDMNASNGLLDQQVNSLSNCLNNAGQDPNQCG